MIKLDKIQEEYSIWKEKMYADNTLQNRKDFAQFFTPPEITVKLIEKFDDLNGTILDPAMGAGNLLAGCIQCGADPDNIYGIEIDPEILKVARERLCELGVPEWHLRLGDATDDRYYEFSPDIDYNNFITEEQDKFEQVSLW